MLATVSVSFDAYRTTLESFHRPKLTSFFFHFCCLVHIANLSSPAHYVLAPTCRLTCTITVEIFTPLRRALPECYRRVILEILRLLFGFVKH